MMEPRLHRRFLKWKDMTSSLEMIMGQNRPADDRKIGIGANEVMRELAHEIKQPLERILGQLHRYMIMMEDDRVFIVVHIR
ncbi:hypothetical protein D3C81_1569750 [compost metagenome]